MKRILTAIFGAVWDGFVGWWEDDRDRGFPAIKGFGLCVLTVVLFYGLLVVLKFAVGLLILGDYR